MCRQQHNPTVVMRFLQQQGASECQAGIWLNGSDIRWRLLSARPNFRMAYSSSNYSCSATHGVDPRQAIRRGCQGDQLYARRHYHASLIWTVSGCDSPGLPLDLTLKSDSSVLTKIRLLFSFTKCKFLCWLRLLIIFKPFIYQKKTSPVIYTFLLLHKSFDN